MILFLYLFNISLRTIAKRKNHRKFEYMKILIISFHSPDFIKSYYTNLENCNTRMWIDPQFRNEETVIISHISESNQKIFYPKKVKIQEKPKQFEIKLSCLIASVCIFFHWSRMRLGGSGVGQPPRNNRFSK